MSKIFHIIKYKSKGYLKATFGVSFTEWIKTFGSSLVYFAFGIGAFFFSRFILEFLLETSKIGQFLLHEFISMIFFIFFLSINIGNIIVSYSTLYKSEEVSFLFTKPVDSGTIFIIKFLDNLFYSSSTLLLVLISLFLGYVTYFELSVFDFILITLFDLLPFIITSASLGVIVLLLLMKLASRIGIRPLIISLALIYSFFLFSFFKIVSPADLVIEVMKSYPNVDIFFGDLISPLIKLLPNQWFSESLYWTINGNSFKSMNLIILQVITAAACFSIAWFLGKKWYYKTWLISFEFKRNSKKSFDKQINFSLGRTAILKKDIILFLREPGQLIHFIILILLTFIFMFSVSGVKNVFFMRTEIQTIIYIVIFLFNTLLISTLSLRFIFPLISLEGLSFWKIKTAPIKVIKLVNIKLLPFFVLVSSVAVLLSFFSNYATSPHLIFYSIIIFIFISFMLIMMNFGMGIIFSKFKEKSAIRIASSQGASLTFLFSLIYMVFLVLVISLPVYIHFDMIKKYNFYNHALLNGAAFIIIVVSSFGGIFFYWFGLRSLKKDF